MSHDLNAVLTENAKSIAIKHIATRPNMTIGQLQLLLDNPRWGAAVKTITLGEIEAAANGQTTAPVATAASTDTTAPKRRGRKPGSKNKKTAKGNRGPKASKKTNPRVAAKASKKASKKKTKTTSKKTTKRGPKPRLDRETGCKEVLAAIKAQGTTQLSKIVAATKYTGPQVRAFCKELLKAKKVKTEGRGRGTTWAAV